MKRKQLERHLKACGCQFEREGANHSWWHNPILNKYSTVPRHKEIDDNLVRKICKDLSISFP